MKRLVLALLAITLLVPASPALAGEGEGESSAQACTAPEHVWGYGPDDMTYEVAIDLSGCDWWDGSPIRLDVSLGRLDAEGETVANVVTLCGVVPTVNGQAYRNRNNATCETGVALEHPGVELARYRGEVTYPWRDGPRTMGFEIFCASPANHCQEP